MKTLQIAQLPIFGNRMYLDKVAGIFNFTTGDNKLWCAIKMVIWDDRAALYDGRNWATIIDSNFIVVDELGKELEYWRENPQILEDIAGRFIDNN